MMDEQEIIKYVLDEPEAAAQEIKRHRELIDQLWDLLPEKPDDACALVVDEYYVIHGPQN